jgi:hypothetical protein
MLWGLQVRRLWSLQQQLDLRLDVVVVGGVHLPRPADQVLPVEVPVRDIITILAGRKPSTSTTQH